MDIAIAGISREVNKVAIENLSISEDKSTANVTFDFLDHKDGALIIILTSSPKGFPVLSGDIIGMPAGIKGISITGTRSKSIANAIRSILAAVLILSTLTLSFYGFNWVTNAWTNVWLLFLPYTALIASIVIIVVVGDKLWPGNRPIFPRTLAPPKWFGHLSLPYLRSLAYPSLEDASKMEKPTQHPS